MEIIFEKPAMFSAELVQRVTDLAQSTDTEAPFFHSLLDVWAECRVNQSAPIHAATVADHKAVYEMLFSLNLPVETFHELDVAITGLVCSTQAAAFASGLLASNAGGVLFSGALYHPQTDSDEDATE